MRPALAIWLAVGIVDLAVLDLVVVPRLVGGPADANAAGAGPALASAAAGASRAIARPTAPPVKEIARAKAAAGVAERPAPAAVPVPASVPVPVPVPASVPVAARVADPVPVFVPEPVAVAATTDPVTLHFGNDRATIYPRAAVTLDRVATALTANPRWVVHITGYADRAGDDDHNLALSRRRARRVIEHLVAHGIAAERLIAVARGEHDAQSPLPRSSADRRVVLAFEEQP